MTQEKIDSLMRDYKVRNLTERKIKNALAREEKKEEEQRNQKPVKSITISIEWKTSRMWGYNPHATAEVRFADGSFERRDGFTASGCGYDKESTVIAKIFNEFLRYRLWELQGKEGAPYGMYLNTNYPRFNGGVGTSCYTSISEFIGGTFENVASGKTFDVFKLEMK